MKMLFLILAIVVVLFLGHNYIQTGSIGIGPSLTEVEKELRRLEGRLDEAVRAYQLAGRGSAIGAADMSGADNAAAGVRYVATELERVRVKLNTPKEKQRFADLERRVKEAKQAMGVR